MEVSQRGIDLIADFEGLIPYAYNDPANHCTFGVGHLIHEGPCNALDYHRFGRKGAQRPHAVARAKRILGEDLEGVELRVTQLVRRGTKQHEFDALCSLAFNIGLGAFQASTVLEMHNRKRSFLAGLAFLRWVFAGGQILPGLVRRRRAERRMYRGKR